MTDRTRVPNLQRTVDALAALDAQRASDDATFTRLERAVTDAVENSGSS